MDLEIGVIAFIVVVALVFIAIQRNSKVHEQDKYIQESLGVVTKKNSEIFTLQKLLRPFILKEIKGVFIQKLGSPEDLGRIVFEWQEYSATLTRIQVPTLNTDFIVEFTHIDGLSSVKITYLLQKRFWKIDEYDAAVKFIDIELAKSISQYMDMSYTDS